MNASAPAPVRPRSHWPFLLAFILVGAVYVWTVASNRRPWNFGGEQRDYYNLLVEGFLDGQLSLKHPVPAALLACPDPYDPAQRPPGVALHDASLYQGKYYIYYGVVPAVLALLPFRAVAGFGLPLPLAVLAFSLIAYALALWLLADLRRRHFPAIGGLSAFLGAAAFGFASCAPILLRRSSMYELPITCGAMFAWAALACLWRAVLNPARATPWIVGCSLACGLAIGSRPTYLLAPAALLLAFVWRLRQEPGSRPNLRSAALAAVIPIAVVGAGLAWYNYARFGRISEFGVSYILSGVYESKIEHFRLRYVGWNIVAYFFTAPEWVRYFPFFQESPLTLARPYQHFGMDYPFSLLPNVPLVWLAVFAFVPRRDAPGHSALRCWLAAVAGIGLATCGMLMGFYAAMARYLGDFAPALALLGVIGGWRIISSAETVRARWARAAAHSAYVAAVLVSIATVFLVSLKIYDRLRTFNPVAYTTLERITNAPVHWIERLISPPAGTVLLHLDLPDTSAPGSRHELFRTGSADRFDRLVLVEVEDDRFILEYEHAGAPPLRSEPQKLDRRGAPTVRIAFGSLAPPLTWPGYNSWTAAQLRAVRQSLEVRVNDQVVLSRSQRFYPAAPSSVTVAAGQPLGRGTTPVLSATFAPLTAPDAEAAARADADRIEAPFDGVWRLQVRFPAPPPTAAKEPLIVSGETGRADFLAVEYLDAGAIRLLFDHWGSAGVVSEPIAIEPGRAYLVTVSHPAYAPAAPSGRPGLLRVEFDGRTVWSASVTLYPLEDQDVYLGSNPVGGSSCGPVFSGTVERIKP